MVLKDDWILGLILASPALRLACAVSLFTRITLLLSSYVPLPWCLSSIWQFVNLVIQWALLVICTLEWMKSFGHLLKQLLIYESLVVFGSGSKKSRVTGICGFYKVDLVILISYQKAPDWWGTLDDLFWPVFQKEARCFKTIEIFYLIECLMTNLIRSRDINLTLPNASNKGSNVVTETITSLNLKECLSKR